MQNFLNPIATIIAKVSNNYDLWKDKEKDPFSILGSDNNVITEIGAGANQFSFADIGALLKNIIFYGGIVSVIFVGLLMLFTKGNEKMYTERKQQIMHKLLIIWLASAAVTLFNILKMILDGVFGF